MSENEKIRLSSLKFTFMCPKTNKTVTVDYALCEIEPYREKTMTGLSKYASLYFVIRTCPSCNGWHRAE